MKYFFYTKIKFVVFLSERFKNIKIYIEMALFFAFGSILRLYTDSLSGLNY